MQRVGDLFKLASALHGLPVLGCRPGSPAAVAGVRYGDVLLLVNGVRTANWEAYVRARDNDDTRLVIVLFRDGAEHTLIVELPRTEEQEDPRELLADLVRAGGFPWMSGS